MDENTSEAHVRCMEMATLFALATCLRMTADWLPIATVVIQLMPRLLEMILLARVEVRAYTIQRTEHRRPLSQRRNTNSERAMREHMYNS